jgi:hypothetical protein
MIMVASGARSQADGVVEPGERHFSRAPFIIAVVLSNFATRSA